MFLRGMAFWRALAAFWKGSCSVWGLAMFWRGVAFGGGACSWFGGVWHLEEVLAVVLEGVAFWRALVRGHLQCF